MLGVYLSLLEQGTDRDAFTALYEGNKYRMVYLARRMLGSEEAAEDAVHEAFLYVAEHYGDLKERYKDGLEGYLYQCVKTRCTDVLRRSGREESYEERLAENALAETAAPAEEGVERVLAALSRLPRSHASILELVGCGWTVREIAEHSGLSVRTVQRRIEQGREWLRREWERENAEHDG